MNDNCSQSNKARAAAEEIFPECFSRTCFIKVVREDSCWGCDDQESARRRATEIIERMFKQKERNPIEAGEMGESEAVARVRQLQDKWRADYNAADDSECEQHCSWMVSAAYEIIAALKSLPTEPSDKWHPIETAPKDGTQVWVWDDERGSNPAIFAEGEWWITYDDAEIQPTHWMPLPDPPPPKEGEE